MILKEPMVIVNFPEPFETKCFAVIAYDNAASSVNGLTYFGTDIVDNKSFKITTSITVSTTQLFRVIAFGI